MIFSFFTMTVCANEPPVDAVAVLNKAVVKKDVVRDPTTPLNNQVSHSAYIEPINLQAIFIRSNSHSAVINGKSVKVGDEIAQHIVTRISSHSVVLTKDTKNTTFHLRRSLREAKP